MDLKGYVTVQGIGSRMRALPEVTAYTLIQPKRDRPCDKWSLGSRILMLVNETLNARRFEQLIKQKRKLNRKLNMNRNIKWKQLLIREGYFA
jgi:hypothetical protein